MTEHAVVDGEAHSRSFHLAAAGLTAQLPGQLADLGDGLGWYGLAERS